MKTSPLEIVQNPKTRQHQLQDKTTGEVFAIVPRGRLAEARELLASGRWLLVKTFDNKLTLIHEQDVLSCENYLNLEGGD